MDRQTMSFEMGSRLKSLREEKGLSYQELADALLDNYEIKISKDSLRDYEINKDFRSKAKLLPNLGMRTEYLYVLAKFYGVSADWLLGLSDYRDDKARQITLDDLGFSEPATNQIASIAGAVLAAVDFGDQANKKVSTVNNPRGFTFQQEARAFLALDILLENPECVLALSNAWAYMRYTGQFDSSKNMELGGKELPESFSAPCGVLVDALWNRVAEPLRWILDDVAQKVEQGTREIDLPEQEGKTKSAPSADNTGDGHKEQKL